MKKIETYESVTITKAINNNSLNMMICSSDFGMFQRKVFVPTYKVKNMGQDIKNMKKVNVIIEGEVTKQSSTNPD